MCVATLSLRHFILKQRVLSFYRTAIRASRGHHLLIFALFFSEIITLAVITDTATRKETISWIRTELERNKHITDLVRQKLSTFPHFYPFVSPGTHRGEVES